jgi:NADPH:quinone reductase-like Zn-dependent oxidoreductase
VKAIVYSEYGGPEVVRLADIDVPVPAEDEILVAVQAAAVNPLDWHLTRGTPPAAASHDWFSHTEEEPAAWRRLRRHGHGGSPST